MKIGPNYFLMNAYGDLFLVLFQIGIDPMYYIQYNIYKPGIRPRSAI